MKKAGLILVLSLMAMPVMADDTSMNSLNDVPSGKGFIKEKGHHRGYALES